jgi:hypothetical protein
LFGFYTRNGVEARRFVGAPFCFSPILPSPPPSSGVHLSTVYQFLRILAPEVSYYMETDVFLAAPPAQPFFHHFGHDTTKTMSSNVIIFWLNGPNYSEHHPPLPASPSVPECQCHPELA